MFPEGVNANVSGNDSLLTSRRAALHTHSLDADEVGPQRTELRNVGGDVGLTESSANRNDPRTGALNTVTKEVDRAGPLTDRNESAFARPKMSDDAPALE